MSDRIKMNNFVIYRVYYGELQCAGEGPIFTMSVASALFLKEVVCDIPLNHVSRKSVRLHKLLHRKYCREDNTSCIKGQFLPRYVSVYSGYRHIIGVQLPIVVID